MSLSGLFSTSTSALLASQTALGVINNNIANVNTPGYSKQDIVLEITNPVSGPGGLSGRGVTVADIRRNYDNFIQSQLVSQQNNYGKAFTLDQTLSQVQQAFNEAQNLGLSTPLNEYFNAWQDVSANPEGRPQRVVLLQKANNLVQRARSMERVMQDNLTQTNATINNLTANINTLASKIAVLNGRIVQVEAGTATKANDLRDQRDNLLKDLSGLTDISYYEDKNGSLTVTAGMRNLVYGEKTNTLSTKINSAGDNDLYLDGTNITANIKKGQVGGLIEARNNIETNSLSGLRRLIAAITNEINIAQSRGFGLNSTAADFTINNITSQQYPATSGVISSATITTFNAFTPGDYDIRFNGAGTAYDVYRNGALLSSANAYISPNPIIVNGMTINFNPLNPPAANDKFYISAKGPSFFNDLSVSSSNKDNSKADVTTAAIFNRTALTYNEYEVRFTGPATYDVYNLDKGVNVITGAAYTSGSSIRFDGLNVVISNITGAPATGDRFLISPLTNAISNFSVAITDPQKVAAASSYAALPGDNTNALNIAQMSNTSLANLGNTTFSAYYKGLVSNIGTSSGAAADSLKFENNMLAELKNRRESVSGVNLDEEAANLLRFQRSYEAGAKMVRITDELMQTILAIKP